MNEKVWAATLEEFTKERKVIFYYLLEELDYLASQLQLTTWQKITEIWSKLVIKKLQLDERNKSLGC